MFDMEKLGANIMRHRKAKGLTQMQLANELGISFQAVSNWERGQSAPDISKLSELSAVLDVSIDEILGNPRTAEIIKQVESDRVPVLDPREAVEVAPILEEKQMDDLVVNIAESMTLSDIIELAPYLSEKALGDMARRLTPDAVNFSELEDLAPYVDEDTITNLALKAVKHGCSLSQLEDIAPYLSEEGMDALINKVISDPSFSAKLSDLEELAPYASEGCIDRATLELVRRGGSMSALEDVAAYLSSEGANAVARELMKQKNLKALKSIIHYIDDDALDDFFDD